MEFKIKSFLWKTFENTGSIDAYLLYKDDYNTNYDKDREEECQTLLQEVL